MSYQERQGQMAGQQFMQGQGQGPQGPAMPTGQQVLAPQQQAGVSYGVDFLPPPPTQQAQGQPGQMLQQPQYGMQQYGQQVQPGVPGTPIAQPIQPGQQVQQAYQVQAPQNYGFPAPQQAPQNYGYGQQPVQQAQGWPPVQQAAGQTVQLQDNVVLDGPGVPQELRGRTWGDARRLYTALSSEWLQRNGRPQTPAAQTLASQGVAPGQHPGQPQYQPQQQMQQGQQDPRGAQQPQFWQNPDQRIQQIVSETVQQSLEPVLRQTRGQAIIQARGVAAEGIADFQQLEPYVMQQLAGASPEDLQNPQVWIAASELVRGRLVAAGQYQFPTQQRQQIPGRGYGQQNYGSPATLPSQPAYGMSAPPAHSFFSEGPTAPSIGGFGPSGAPQPTQDDMFYASKWQMPIDQFMAWKYGQQVQQPGMGGAR